MRIRGILRFAQIPAGSGMTWKQHGRAWPILSDSASWRCHPVSSSPQSSSCRPGTTDRSCSHQSVHQCVCFGHILTKEKYYSVQIQWLSSELPELHVFETSSMPSGWIETGQKASKRREGGSRRQYYNQKSRFHSTLGFDYFLKAKPERFRIEYFIFSLCFL